MLIWNLFLGVWSNLCQKLSYDYEEQFLVFRQELVQTLSFSEVFGVEFVVSFFSGSRPLTLKSSLKSHQMTTFLIQNEY